MIHHYITKYIEGKNQYAEAWIQVDFFDFSFCLWKRRIKI